MLVAEKENSQKKQKASYTQMQVYLVGTKNQIDGRLNQKDYCKTLQKLVEYVLLLNVVCGFLNSPYLFSGSQITHIVGIILKESMWSDITGIRFGRVNM